MYEKLVQQGEISIPIDKVVPNGTLTFSWCSIKDGYRTLTGTDFESLLEEIGIIEIEGKYMDY